MISISHWGMFQDDIELVRPGSHVVVNPDYYDWCNRLPFFNTVLTPDGKTGRELARDGLRAWADRRR